MKDGRPEAPDVGRRAEPRAGSLLGSQVAPRAEPGGAFARRLRVVYEGYQPCVRVLKDAEERSLRRLG